MRLGRFGVVLLFCPFLVQSSPAQTSDPTALQLLQRSQVALTGGQTLSDATLSGTARRIVGSDNHTGSGVLKVISSGASRVDLNLSSGQYTEIHDASTRSLAGSWSGPDRVWHDRVFHNLLTEPSWFFPTFAVARALSPTGYIATYVGRETHNGQAVEHVSVSQILPPRIASFQRLTQINFFLDATTLLPAAIGFNIHPDNNALRDILIEVRFADYRALGSSHIPYHVQKYLNNGLTLDIQASSVNLNTGLTVDQITAH